MESPGKQKHYEHNQIIPSQPTNRSSDAPTRQAIFPHGSIRNQRGSLNRGLSPSNGSHRRWQHELVGEFIASCWFQAQVHREDGDPNCEADAAAYTWAAIDATLLHDEGNGSNLRTWVETRLETLPARTFEDDTIIEIRSIAMDILMDIASNGHL